MPRMLILTTSSSSLTVPGGSGGDVTSALMAMLMSGKQLLETDPMAHPVPSVQTREHVSTIHWPPSILTLLQSSVPGIRAQLMTIWLAVRRRCSDNANMDMNMLLRLTSARPTTLAVLNALQFASHHSLGNNILCWLTAHIQSCTFGMQS